MQRKRRKSLMSASILSQSSHNSRDISTDKDIDITPEQELNERLAEELRRAERSKMDRSKLPYKEILKEISCISTDAEYLPVINSPTVPLVVTFGTLDADESGSMAYPGEYLHPNHPFTSEELAGVRTQLNLQGESQKCLTEFTHGFALLDYLKDGWGIASRKLDGKRKKVHTIKLFFFWSFKDLEFLWADKDFYRNEILPRLSRIRRITTPYGKPIALPYEIALKTSRNKVEWHSLSIELVDISAMQGAKGLETYMLNVGLSTTDKSLYTKADKSRMDLRLLENPEKYLRYIRADVSLEVVYMRTIQFYNRICELIGLESREVWDRGLSTGAIVASITSEWLANEVQVPVKDTVEYLLDSAGVERKKETKGFYNYTRLASPESVKQMSHLTGKKEMLYLGMTDGGRCVKERPHIHALEGCLIDIDIAGCYANGLLNQTFPVGNPTIQFQPMTFGEWEKKYKKLLVPGLWFARISWENAPFRQDLLISKDDKQFGSWDFYQRQYNGENASDKDVQYDATMYLMATDIKHAALTHDLYQVFDKYASNSEKAWVRANAIIECFAYYPVTDEVQQVDEGMLTIKDVEEASMSGFKWSTKWVGVKFKKLMEILIPERAKHKKVMKQIEDKYSTEIKEVKDAHKLKTEKVLSIEDALDMVMDSLEYDDYLLARSTQEFIKLINNTIYGCIASTFFATNGTGLSNYIVGNNITARARTLAWCMAKGLHMVMSVTDGGVYDLNKVLLYRECSLGIFEAVSRDEFKDSQRHKVVDAVPLYGRILETNELADAVKGSNGFVKVEVIAWTHLKNIFGKLDIFSQDQFTFEVKKPYTNLEIRNKSDYRLSNKISGDVNIKLRGLKANGSNVEVFIFDDILNGENNIHDYYGQEMLGLSDYRTNRDTYQNLLPHDIIDTHMSYSSYTPLGKRFINEEHRRVVLKLYEEYKKTGDHKAQLHLSLLDDSDGNIEEIKTRLQELRVERKRKRSHSK